MKYFTILLTVLIASMLIIMALSIQITNIKGLNNYGVSVSKYNASRLVYVLKPIINNDVKSYSGDVIPLTKTYTYSEPVWSSVFGGKPKFQIYIGAMDGYATIYSGVIKLIVEKIGVDKYNLSLILINDTIITNSVGYRIYGEANYSLKDILRRFVFTGKLYEASAPKPFSSIKAYREIIITITVSLNTTSNEYFTRGIILGSWIFRYSGEPLIYVVPNTHYSIVKKATSLTGLDIKGIVSCFIASNETSGHAYTYKYNGVERRVEPGKIIVYKTALLDRELVNRLISSRIIDKVLWINSDGFNEPILVINNTYYVGAPRNFPPLTLVYDEETGLLIAVNPDQSVLGRSVPGTIFSYLIPQVFNAYLGVNTRFFIEPIPPYNWASLVLVEASTQ
jgi:hypothetical protein